MNKAVLAIFFGLLLSVSQAFAACPDPASPVSTTEETCPGAADGTITINFDVPANFAYFVVHLTAAGGPSIITPTVVESGNDVTFSGLEAGNYSISVVEFGPICVTTFNGTGSGIVVGNLPFPSVLANQTKSICSGDQVDLEILLDPVNFPAGSTLDWAAPVMSDGSSQGTAGVAVPADPAGTIHITDVLNNTTGASITATYSVFATNGTCTTGPVDVVITVDPSPVILPDQTKTICGGDPVDLEILLSPLNAPAGTTFDWSAPTMSDGSVQGTAGVAVPADPAGTLHITDILNNMSAGPITATYTVTPSNTCVGDPVDVVITVEPTPALVAGQNKVICSGEAVNLEILLNPANTPPGTTFDWPVPVLSDGSSQGTAGVDVPADPAGTLHITDVIQNTTGADITATYTVTPHVGVCTGNPEDIVITIRPEPVILPNQATTVCSGDPVNFKVLLTPAGQPPATVYNWSAPVMSDGSSQGTAGVNVPESDPLHITDALTNTTGAVITATYTITPSAAGCAGDPEIVVVTVNPEPVVAPGQDKIICSGETVDLTILLTPDGLPAGSELNWPAPVMSDGSIQGSPGVDVPADNGGLPHITDLLVNTTGSDITATYSVTPNDGATCFGQTVDIVITVSAEPVIQPAQTTTVCSGDAIDYRVLMTPLNLPTNTVFSWPAPVVSAGPAQGTAGTDVPLGADPNPQLTDVLVNTTGAPITVTYTITPSNNGCPGISQDIVVTVNPEPVIAPDQTVSICSGDPANLVVLLTPDLQPAGTLYNWSAPVMSDGSTQGTAGVDVPADNGGAPHITDAFVNQTGEHITATYTIIPNDGGTCFGQPETVVITIEPVPVVLPGQTKSICSGDPVDLEILLSPANLPPGTLLSWSAPVMSDGSTQGSAGTDVAADPAGTIHISDVLVNPGVAPITATYTVTPSHDNCTGDPEVIVIDIFNSLQDVAINESGAQAACVGSSQDVTLATSENGVDYEILVNGTSSGLPVVTGDGSADLLIGSLSGLAAGSYTITVQATAGNCSIVLSDAIDLELSAVPSSAINGSPTVCENTATIYTAEPDATTYTWTVTGGGTIINGAGTNQIEVSWGTTGGDIELTVVGAAPASCSSTSVFAVVTLGTPPQLEESFVEVCQNEAPPTFTVTPAPGADVNWYINGVDPTNLVANGPNFTPDSDVLDMTVPGGTNFIATQTFGCNESQEALHAVLIYEAPYAGENNLSSTCIDGDPIDLFTLLGGTPQTGGTWTDDDNSGALTGSLFDPQTSGDGVFEFTYSVAGTGICAGSGSSAVITMGVVSGSNLPAVDQSDFLVCMFSQPPTIAATGTNIEWYADEALTQLIGSGPEFTPIPGAHIDLTEEGEFDYYVTQDEGCGRSVGVRVDVTVTGVRARIGSITASYPEQDIGSITVTDISSDAEPIQIVLFDESGDIVSDWQEVMADPSGVLSQEYLQLAAGNYEVLLEDANGCQVRLSPILVPTNTEVFIPNVFTPNGDSFNDEFRILNSTSPMKIVISNRWGSQVFASDDYQNDWAGENVVDGVYFYTISMGGKIYKGNVEVWRGGK